MEITLNLIATKEGDEDFVEELGVDLELEDNVDVRALIGDVLRRGIRAVQEDGLKIKDYLFFS